MCRRPGIDGECRGELDDNGRCPACFELDEKARRMFVDLTVRTSELPEMTREQALATIEQIAFGNGE